VVAFASEVALWHVLTEGLQVLSALLADFLTLTPPQSSIWLLRRAFWKGSLATLTRLTPSEHYNRPTQQVRQIAISVAISTDFQP